MGYFIFSHYIWKYVSEAIAPAMMWSKSIVYLSQIGIATDVIYTEITSKDVTYITYLMLRD